MKILIVEDGAEKAKALAKVVEKAGVRPDDVIRVPDAVAARDRLKSEIFDILLVDLQIPQRFGDGPNKEGGADLLRWLDKRKSSAFPSSVVAVTGYDLEKGTEDLLNSLGIPVVRYAPSRTEWSIYIAGVVQRALRVNRVAHEEKCAKDIRAVVITAVDVEHEHVKRVFEIQGSPETRLGVNWHRADLSVDQETVTVIVAQADQMGMPAAAVLTAKAIRLWSPQMLFMAGICAGVKGEVNIGDIVVPESCWDYGSGKLTSDGTLKPDPRPVDLREWMRTQLRLASDKAPLERWLKEFPSDKPDTFPKVHIKPAASGASVVADLRTVDSVQQHSRKVVGIDMENYGFYFAVANSGREPEPKFCSAKAVVDFADPEKRDRYQQYGAHISAKFVRWLIENAPHVGSGDVVSSR